MRNQGGGVRPWLALSSAERSKRLKRELGGPETRLSTYGSAALRDEALIVFMRPNPEPDHGAPFKESERTILTGDANGVDRLGRMNLLESETWVSRIPAEEAIGGERTTADFGRECLERLPEPPRGTRLHSPPRSRE